MLQDDEKQQKRVLKLASSLDGHGEMEILDQLIEIADLIESTSQEVTQAIKEIPVPGSKDTPHLFEIENLPDIQKVEVLNFPAFPKFPEQKAPIVNVPAPEVIVEAPLITINNKGVETEIAKITALLSKENEIEETKILDEDGKIVDFKKLFHALSERIGNIRTGGGYPQNLNVTITGQTVFAIQIDDVSTTSVTYIGKATIGSSTSSAVWQIQKVNQSGTPITAVITWAGNGAFNQIWSSRTSLTYI